jgi:hypothetical protein
MSTLECLRLVFAWLFERGALMQLGAQAAACVPCVCGVMYVHLCVPSCQINTSVLHREGTFCACR